MPLGFFKWGIPFEYVIWMADMMIHQMLVSDKPKNSRGIWRTPCYLTLFHLLGVFSVWDYRSETSWWYSIAGAVCGGGGGYDDADDDGDDDDVGYINNHHDVAAGNDESTISQIMAIRGFIMIC